MSTSTSQFPPLPPGLQPPAPWRRQFQTNLEKSPSTSFTLATIAHCPNSNVPVPRTRTCEFRGFWPNPSLHPAALEALLVQGVGINPAVYESDMISLTTDARMEKVEQLGYSRGIVEGVFWLKDVGSQWRVRGRAYIIGDPAAGEGEEKAREGIWKGMRVRERGGEEEEVEQEVAEDGGVAEWSWEREVTGYFANHSPVMRGSFRNPPPGQPRSQTGDDPELKLGQIVEDLHDPVARRNFRVVVIAPEEVERLDLSDLGNVRRTKWTLVEEGENNGGRWEEAELWP